MGSGGSGRGEGVDKEAVLVIGAKGGRGIGREGEEERTDEVV